MTAQSSEILLFNNEEVRMATEPLRSYLETRKDVKFVRPTTACWRGYYGKWDIRENKLFLISLEAYLERSKAVGMDYLFPGYETVFAEWFSGEIRIPQGEILENVHMGYSSTYEKDLFLEFESGVLINQRTVDNRFSFKPRKYSLTDSTDYKATKPLKRSFWSKLFSKGL